MGYRAKAKASVPQFLGARASMGWFDLVKPHLAQHEGNESMAYHGALTSFRKAGKKTVEPGHNSTEEVSVGYGFNLQRKDARDVFKRHLGLADQGYDDVFNGRRPVTPGEAEKLLTFGVYEANNQIDHALRGAPPCGTTSGPPWSPGASPDASRKSRRIDPSSSCPVLEGADPGPRAARCLREAERPCGGARQRQPALLSARTGSSQACTASAGDMQRTPRPNL